MYLFSKAVNMCVAGSTTVALTELVRFDWEIWLGIVRAVGFDWAIWLGIIRAVGFDWDRWLGIVRAVGFDWAVWLDIDSGTTDPSTTTSSSWLPGPTIQANVLDNVSDWASEWVSECYW